MRNLGKFALNLAVSECCCPSGRRVRRRPAITSPPGYLIAATGAANTAAPCQQTRPSNSRSRADSQKLFPLSLKLKLAKLVRF